MSLTAQISARLITPDPAPLTTPVPRPRGADESEAPPRERSAPSVALPPPQRAKVDAIGLILALDAAIAVAVSVTAAALGGLTTPLAAGVAVAWPVVLLASGHYRRRALGESRGRRLLLLAGTGLRAAVVALALAPWFTGVDGPELAGLVAVLTVASGCHRLLGLAPHRPRLVLAGRPRDVAAAIAELRVTGRHEVVAACLTRDTQQSFGGLPTYVGFQDPSGVAQAHQADAFVVLPGSRLGPAEVRRLHWALAGVGTELCVGTGLMDVTPDRARVLSTGSLNLVHVAPASLRGPRRWVKDVVERVAATLGLALVLPLLVAVVVLVRLDTPGPALYRQTRVGRDGRVFTMYKFRSMCLTADAERAALAEGNECDDVLFKIRHDPRVTRTGRWLRRWSIDEVPQLWNVVRGDMALVGPRPALPEEVARYDLDPTRRLVVKPGLTGLWQVSGRSDLSWAESVRLDVRYVDNWSLRLDLAILLRTVRAVLGHQGAY